MKPVKRLIQGMIFDGYLEESSMSVLGNPLKEAVAILRGKAEQLASTTRFRESAYRTIVHAQRYLEQQAAQKELRKAS